MNTTSDLTELSYFPIQDMSFKGLHWIEASAGTGKTYTLSSLMVRIFLSGYLPHQVVATTFTRAAAAELKSRVRMRIAETLHYFEQLQQQSLNQKDIEAKIEVEKDPLFQKILKDYATKLDFVCNRLALVMNQLDELFVSTLDSFSQKLLREFSFESGKIERAEITEDARKYNHQLIHDVLREWIDAQPQSVIDNLMLAGTLKNVDAYVDAVNSSLNFTSAQFNDLAFEQLDLTDVHAAVEVLKTVDVSSILDLADYYENPEGNYAYIHGTKYPKRSNSFPKLMQSVPKLIEAIQQYGWQSYFQKGFKEHQKFAEKLYVSLTEEKALFTAKVPADVAERFFNHPFMQACKLSLGAFQVLATQLQKQDAALKAHIIQEVKKRLPQVLQAQGETTFAQQIRILAEALQGEQGQIFAQIVHTRYPLILVDEFQDTNQDQDNMLAQIWRNAKWYRKGCMIMVGDPKQAIYGFRGGDMLTYNNARDDVIAKRGKRYSLQANHRSVKELVAVVDELFQRQTAFGEDVHYTPVEAGPRPHPALVELKEGQLEKNHVPLRWLNIEDGHQEALKVAWQIRDLLNQGAQQQLYFENKDGTRSLIADDIAVLSRNHDGLDKVQYELERLGITVNRASKRSVFDSFVAKDVAAILTAIMHPYDESRVKRALLSRLLDFNLQELQQLEQSNQLSQFMYDFDYIREMWINKGFLSAWQYALNLFKVWEKLVAYQSRDNERVVVNLRHLTEILSQQNEYYQGAQALYQWYLNQLQSASDRDWEKERRLSNASGVELMTVHQSKGLEFKIVFLLGANKPSTDQEKHLNFSIATHEDTETGKTSQQRVLTVKSAQLDDAAKQTHKERHDAEQNRLWYVALTRASHRVYAVLPKLKKGGKGALLIWRDKASVSAELVEKYSADESEIGAKPSQIQAAQQVTALTIHAEDFPTERSHFYAKTKTSFSALAQHKPSAHVVDQIAAVSVVDGQAADENHQLPQDEQVVTQPLAWIKQNFPKGAHAGNFLHEIFEHIDFQNSSDWELELHRRFGNDYPDLWSKLSTEFKKDFNFANELKVLLEPLYLQQTQVLQQEWQRYGQQMSELQYRLLRDSFYHCIQAFILQSKQSVHYPHTQQQWQTLFAQSQQFNWAALQQSFTPLLDLMWKVDVTEIHQNLLKNLAELEAEPIAVEKSLTDLQRHLDISLWNFVEDWIESILFSLLTDWLQQVLNTPLHDGFQLQQLQAGTHLSEFPFYLSLADEVFAIQKIQQHFQNAGIDLHDLNPAYSARYLTGSIDLVYYDGQRYHIADYKSNHLGADQQAYQEQGICSSMSDARYWLQAGLYLVALHRYLSAQMPDYDIEQHLGNATYLYLRGMNGRSEAGFYTWQPSSAFVLELDRILGCFAADVVEQLA